MITSASVMLNQDNTRLALDYIRRRGEPRFGIHLNLSEGRFLSSPERELAYTVSHAKFYFSYSASDRAAYLEEIEHQLDYGLRHFAATHLDTHYHVHTFPLYWLPVMRAARRHGLRWVRNTYTFFGREAPYKAMARSGYRALLRRYGLSTTDYFFDLAYFIGHRGEIERLPRDCSIEVMCHPRAGNEDYDMLRSNDMKGLRAAFQLVSYGTIR
jgi:predicted glycoside hydrolase/deacetylase ChbG (UPF0249 family)